jgi:hypothetical protein
MKKYSLACWLALGVILLVSCANMDQGIQPGDRIGEMEFISDYDDCPAPNLNEICSFDSLFNGTCEIPADVTRFWISSGWMEGSWDQLNLAWKESQWKMTFDDQEVDLDAFGITDIDWQIKPNRLWDVCKQTSKEVHSEREKARMWNVCVAYPSPGKHIVRYEFYMKNGPWRGSHVETFAFTVFGLSSQK